jgi:hypothetical protein
MRPRQCLDLLGVAADQDRVGHHLVAVGERHAALGTDRKDRSDQVLVQAHAPGHAVHDEAEGPGRHVCPLSRHWVGASPAAFTSVALLATSALM